MLKPLSCFFSIPPRASLMLLFIGLGFPLLLPGQEDENVEIIVNVLPGKGMKFDAEVLYREDQEVIQGVLGSADDDEVQALRILPTGHILMAGYMGSPASKLAGMPRLGCSEPGASAGPFIGITDSQFRNVAYVAFLPSRFARIRHIEIARDGAIFLGGESIQGSGEQGLTVMKLPANLSTVIWQAFVRGDQMSGMAVLPDDTIVVAPNQSPFISRLKADGSDLIPFGADQHFRTDAKNPQIYQKWWLDQHYPESGVASATYNRGNAGGIGVTRDGNLVFLTSNFVRHKNGTPDFDPMLIKFTPEGEILWATHLLDKVPALSDHKSPHLYICPYSGDIIATMRQHGHFADNLLVGERAYLKTDDWLTGNIMIGWIGRIDPDTGGLKAGTMYFPDVGSPPEGGKRRANSLLPSAIRTDKDNNIYLTGIAAYKLETTLHAFQAEKMGDTAFISVFDPTLTRLRYANFITGPGFSYIPTAMVITELGPLVASQIRPKEGDNLPRRRLIHSNTDKTNFLFDRSVGKSDILFSLLPSAPWKEEW